MAKIVITGNKEYVAYLARHLKKEHPSTKNKIRLFGFNNNNSNKNRGGIY